jgi:hypothetical protein
MTGPCSVRELTEATGLERHTAEAIRMKVLFAIASAQESIRGYGLARDFCACFQEAHV